MQSEREIESGKLPILNRFGILFEGWCNRCGKPVGVLRLEEMALAGITLQGICRSMEEDRLHLADAGSESLLICLNSLFDY